jgi:hypothetical protein
MTVIREKGLTVPSEPLRVLVSQNVVQGCAARMMIRAVARSAGQDVLGVGKRVPDRARVRKVVGVAKGRIIIRMDRRRCFISCVSMSVGKMLHAWSMARFTTDDRPYRRAGIAAGCKKECGIVSLLLNQVVATGAVVSCISEGG